jgi:hypothetical protein
MMEIPVTVENYKKGARVKRGKDWEWGDQDGDKTGIGKLVELERYGSIGWVTVEWEDNCIDNDYRAGAKDSYDLYYVEDMPSLDEFTEALDKLEEKFERSLYVLS